MATSKKAAKKTSGRSVKVGAKKTSAKKAAAGKLVKVVVWSDFEPKLTAVRDALAVAADARRAVGDAVTALDKLLADPPGVENVRK